MDYAHRRSKLIRSQFGLQALQVLALLRGSLISSNQPNTFNSIFVASIDNNMVKPHRSSLSGKQHKAPTPSDAVITLASATRNKAGRYPHTMSASCKMHVTLTRQNLKVISVSINGMARQFDTPVNVANLLDQMQLGGKRIAVECNGEIIPRGQFNQRLLADGDKLEIVVAVGGG